MLGLWAGHKIQRAHLRGESLFPLEVPFPKPSARTLAEKFPEVREWIRRLRNGAKETVGRGYKVEYRQISHRRLGEQAVPNRIVIESLEDFLALAGQEAEFRRFAALSERILASWPGLRDFLCGRPSLVLEHGDEWDRLLAVCRYFRDQPRQGLYLRQLDIPGVDTKFIEDRRALLADLLEVTLPVGAKIDGVQGLSDHGFERRFGLKFEPPLVRFRLLDPALSLAGMTDVTATLPELQSFSLPVRRVFVVENKVNGLCFPACRGSMVVFGLGYGAGTLAKVPWLKDVELLYWGDIDTHGFSILDQFRAAWPHVRSFLMDEETLMSSRDLWGKEEQVQRFRGRLDRLTPEERSLFEALLDDKWGIGVRLEQERIPFGRVQRRLADLTEAG